MTLKVNQKRGMVKLDGCEVNGLCPSVLSSSGFVDLFTRYVRLDKVEEDDSSDASSFGGMGQLGMTAKKE